MHENGMKQIENEFVERNIELIENGELDVSIKKILEDIHETYKDDIFQYAEIQIGLSRFLDFNLNANKFSNLLNSIGNLAILIIQFHRKSCGQHEDGACRIGSFSYNRSYLNLKYPAWPDLPFADALSFNSPARPITLPKGRTIYRIIGKNGHRNGHWWFEGPLINSPKQWRSDFSVLTVWNKGTHCVSAILDEELNVWQGKTAPQVVYLYDKNGKFQRTNKNCYLVGGGLQIWLEPKNKNLTIKPLNPWP